MRGWNTTSAVVKVRATTHSNELRLFHVDGHGVQINEMLADHDGLLGGRPRVRTAFAGNGNGTSTDITVPIVDG